MTTTTIRVRIDGAVYPVTLRYEHWLPALFRTDGVTIGTTIYFRRPYPEPSRTLLGHELYHAADFVRRWNRTPLALYWVAVAWDLAAYALAWALAGFRYSQIPEEIAANRLEYQIGHGFFPEILILEDGL